MRTSHTRFLFVLIAVFTISSCVSKKKLTYLQPDADLSRELSELINHVTPADYEVKPYDYLYINVVTPDPRWSEMFNASAGEGTISEESAVFISYPVDARGYIKIPYVGKILVAGDTVEEISAKLDEAFKSYVKDAAIRVRLVNNTISLIGEFNNPGRYRLEKDRVTIFEALSLGGDLSDYSDRMKIQLIRPTEFGPVIKEFRLRDRSILSSEYYYVMPNDIIYAPPLRGRTFQMNAFIYSLALGVINMGLVIYALIEAQRE
ncbi:MULTISPECIES: polysaccharide biosynthesis/export family protein [unclassified Carboxylicivirga]|uniref:polysaccharide biosynthesis/export family protein n=1 Tax=Carboxylicivirga TaxID=1628153 RepID=UPI003D3434D3